MNEGLVPSLSAGSLSKLNRSCEPCRLRKVRCSSAASADQSRCSRCIERNLVCEYKLVSKRNRQRVSARIKELENKIEALLSLVPHWNTSADSTSQAIASATLESPLSPNHSPLPTSSSKSTDNRAFSNCNLHDPLGSLNLDSLSEDRAIVFFNHFQQKLLPHYPVLFLPATCDPKAIRQEKPFLFFSIITAGAAALEPNIATLLNQDLERRHAQSTLVDGIKTLDLAQALLISSIWAYPPRNYAGLKFGRYAQMTADILFDLDLLQSLDEQLLDNGVLSCSCFSEENAVLDNCRTLVACFMLCSSIALAFRRPSIITYTGVIGKCITFLRNSPHAAPQDNTLADWATLQCQAGRIASITALNACDQYHVGVQHTLAQLSAWATDVKQGGTYGVIYPQKDYLYGQWLTIKPASLVIHYHYICVYAYERALYSEYQPGDFKPPYAIRNTGSGIGPRADPQPALDCNTPFALKECLLAGRLLLDTFLAFTVDELRTVPVIVYARMFYVIVMFAKIFISIQSLDNQLRNLVDPESLAFDFYLSKLIAATLAAKGQESFCVPLVFHGMLQRISNWCIVKLQQQLLGLNFDDKEELRPLEFEDPMEEVTVTPLCSSILPPSNPSIVPAIPNPWPPEFSSILPFLDDSWMPQIDTDVHI